MTTARTPAHPESTRDPDAASVLTLSQVQRRSPAGRFAAAHPWVADALPVATVLVLGWTTVVFASGTIEGAISLGLFRPDAPVRDVAPAVWLAGAAIGGLLLIGRRSWPLAVTGSLTVLALVSLATAGVLGVLGVCLAWALRTVAATRGARTGAVAGAVVLAVVTVALWRWEDIGLAEMLVWSDPLLTSGPEPTRSLTEPPFSAGRRSMSVAVLLALFALGVATGSEARARRQHARDLLERYAAMARDRDTSAALARSAERARIAREMHDVIAHSVSVMVALSDGARLALDRAPDRSAEALAQLSLTGRAALTDMQSVLGALDPGDDERDDVGGERRPAPAGTDLATVVDRFSAAGVPLRTSGLDTPLPHDTALRLAVVRIVTESLTNVLRHAPGTPAADLTVRRTGAGMEIDVLDAGGTRPGSGGGTHRGILGMRERAALLGGHVEAGPRDGGGWRVHVVLPWGDAADGDRA